MSDIGGLPLYKDTRRHPGSVYGEEGKFFLTPAALDIFLIIADKISKKKLLDEVNGNAIIPLKEGDFRAALYKVGHQPFLLMFSEKHTAESFVFDPEAKTFLGRAHDVFPALYNKVVRESKFIADVEKRAQENKGLVPKFVETNAAHLISTAVIARQQAAYEFMSLKQAAEKISIFVPSFAYQKLPELCALLNPPEEEAAPCAAVRPSGLLKALLARVLG